MKENDVETSNDSESHASGVVDIEPETCKVVAPHPESKFDKLLKEFRRLDHYIRTKARVDRRLTIAGIVIALIGLVGLPSIFLDTCVFVFHEELEDARSLSQNGKIGEAIKKYRAVAIDAEERGCGDVAVYAWTTVGFLSSKNNDAQGALLAYEKAIRLQPGNAYLYVFRGNVKRELDQARDAILDYSTAISLQPDFATAFLHRGLAEKRLGQTEAAIANYDEAIRLQPSSPWPWVNRGRAYATLGEHEKAYADYTKAIRLAPTFAGTYWNRGNTNLKLDRVVEAFVDYDTAIEWWPRHPASYILRGKAFLSIDRAEDALSDYSTAIKLQPGNPALYFARHTANLILDETNAACDDLDTALRLFETVGFSMERIDQENRVVGEVDANRPIDLTEFISVSDEFIAQVRESLADTCEDRQN